MDCRVDSTKRPVVMYEGIIITGRAGTSWARIAWRNNPDKFRQILLYLIDSNYRGITGNTHQVYTGKDQASRCTVSLFIAIKRLALE